MLKFPRARVSLLSTALACLTLLLGLNAVVAYFALDRISTANLRVQAAQQILTELQGTLTLLLECETGQRGYVITGKREYLEPYERALSQIGRHLANLESHASQDPVLSARLPELKSVSITKLQELAQTVDLTRRGQRQAALDTVGRDSGKAAMDRLTQMIEEMTQEQRAIVKTSVARQQESIRRARYTLFLANVVAIFFLLVIGYLLRREARTRAAAEEKLRLAEKLSATARMAHTMAHYVNNPLEALSNCIYLARSDPDLNANTRHLLEVAEEQVARAGHISKQTLGLRRKPQPETLSLPKLLDEVIALYSNQIEARNIQVIKDYAFDGVIIGDKDDLREAVANVVSNGIEACQRGGTVKIQTLHKLESIVITVEDNGTGVAREHRSRLFSPFFTTKPVGTGLGLWAAKQIVESYGGSITFTSSVGGKNRGTMFSIKLPVAVPAQASEAAAI